VISEADKKNLTATQQGEKILIDMGAVNVLNLDGGASSRMYVEGLGMVTNQQSSEPNRYIGSVLQVVPK